MASAIGEQSPCLELLCDIPFTLKVTRQGDSDRKDKDTSDENTVLPQNSLGFFEKNEGCGSGPLHLNRAQSDWHMSVLTGQNRTPKFA